MLNGNDYEVFVHGVYVFPDSLLFVLTLKRDSSNCLEQVACHLQKTRFQAAADEIYGALEEARGSSTGASLLIGGAGVAQYLDRIQIMSSLLEQQHLHH